MLRRGPPVQADTGVPRGAWYTQRAQAPAGTIESGLGGTGSLAPAKSGVVGLCPLRASRDL